MITFTCSACRKPLRVKDELAGKRVKCPGCGQAAKIPEAGAQRTAAVESGRLSPVPSSGTPAGNPTRALRGEVDQTAAPTLPPNAPWGGDASSAETLGAVDSPHRGADRGDEGELTEFLAPAQAADEIGRLGTYRVLAILGHGGMGAVFRAHDPHLDRLIALKVMLPALAGKAANRERFLREARAAARVKDDHVVAIHQISEDRGVPFVAMEFLEGEPLDVRLKRQPPLSLAETIRIGRETALGLDAAHKKGLIHRDIKPGNLWLEGERGRVKILDFGLARALADDTHLTQSGAIVGTPAFMAPEQASGQPVDHRCDLFSLGCVLYRLATGEMPFKGNDTISLLSALALQEPPAPASVNANIPEELSELIVQLLSKTPDGRPASAQDVAARLADIDAQHDAVLTGNRPAPRTQSMPRKAKTDKIILPRQRRSLVPILAVAAVVAIGVGGYFAYRSWNGGPLGQVALDQKEDKDKFPPRNPENLVAVEVHSFDQLDAAKIPPEERYPWQPKPLLAVIGEHRGRHPSAIRQLQHSPNGKLIVSVGSFNWYLWDAATLRLYDAAGRGGSRADRIAFVSDGTLATYLGQGGSTVQLWDVSGPDVKPLQSIESSGSNMALAIACAAKARVLVAPQKRTRETLQVWDLSGPQPKPTSSLVGSKDQVTGIAITPDGKTVAGRSFQGNNLFLWDVDGPQPEVRALLTNTSGGFAFACDGKVLVTSNPGKAILWDLSQKQPRELAAIPGAGSPFAVSPDGNRLACNTSGGPALFDISGAISGAKPEQYAAIKVAASDISFSPDGQRLVVTGSAEPGLMRLWDLTGPVPLELLEPRGHLSELTETVLAPDGKTLATIADKDKVVRLWDMTGAAPRERAVLRGNTAYVISAAFSRNGKFLATSGWGGILVWDMAPVEPIVVASYVAPSGGGGGTGYVEFSPDGKTLAVYSHHEKPDPAVRILDFTGEALVERAILPNSGKQTGRPFAFSPDGNSLASFVAVTDKSSRATAVRVWDLNPKTPKQTMMLLPTEPYQHATVRGRVSFLPDGKTLAVAGEMSATRGGFVVWDLADAAAPRVRALLEGSSTKSGAAMTLSADGQIAAFVRDGAGSVECWDVGKRAMLLSAELPFAVNNLTLTPDGQHLITANSNGTAYVLRLAKRPWAQSEK